MADPGKSPRKVQPLARKNCRNSLEKKSTIEVLRKFDSNLFKGALFFVEGLSLNSFDVVILGFQVNLEWCIAQNWILTMGAGPEG